MISRQIQHLEEQISKDQPLHSRLKKAQEALELAVSRVDRNKAHVARAKESLKAAKAHHQTCGEELNDVTVELAKQCPAEHGPRPVPAQQPQSDAALQCLRDCVLRSQQAGGPITLGADQIQHMAAALAATNVQPPEVHKISTPSQANSASWSSASSGDMSDGGIAEGLAAVPQQATSSLASTARPFSRQRERSRQARIDPYGAAQTMVEEEKKLK
jgi:hypothetical protein